MPLREISDRANLEREDRAFVAEVEFRETNEGGLTFDGIASTVDKPYSVFDMFGEYQETIVRGAFTKTLKEKDDVRLLKNHDPNFVFARTKPGTLNLSATPDLRAIADLDAANPNVQVLRSEMGRGDVDEMSIGFKPVRQEWNGDYTERTIREAQLFDVSVVTAGMSPHTAASLRALDESIRALTETDEWDEPTLRRAIAHLETLLPQEEHEEPEQREQFDYLAHLQELWDKRQVA